MDDPKQEKSGSQKSTDELLNERQSDATDDETLSEVEESRSDLDPGESERSGAISPDGALDESDELADVEPM